MAVIAGILGIALGIIGAPIAFYVVSGFFKSRRIKKLTKDQNTPKITAVSNQLSPLKAEQPTQDLKLVNAEQRIKELWSTYKTEYHESVKLPFTTCSLISLQTNNAKEIVPDAGLGNLVLTFENDPQVLFLPTSYHITGFNQELLHPEQEPAFTLLTQALSLAFATGKSIVVARGSDGLHSTTLAFRKDGKFKIIDSLSSTTTVDIAILTKKLNEAGIQDGVGQKITFKGKYVHTGLQKGTKDCMRFSTLYAFAIAKQQNLGGYKAVNSAFKVGKLNKFEDVLKLDFTSKREAGSAGSDIPNEHYIPFMRSWAFRTKNLTWDHWKDIPLQELPQSKEERYEVIVWFSESCYNAYPARRLCTVGQQSKSLFIKNSQGLTRSVSYESIDNQATLGDLKCNEGEKLAVFKEHGQSFPTIIRLKKDESLIQRVLDNNVPVKEFVLVNPE